MKHTNVLRVSTVNSSWGNSLSGPMFESASPVKETGSFVLYEATIWRDEGKVTLYRFGAGFDAQRAWNECGGDGARYSALREQYAVASYALPTGSDATTYSATLRNAFADFYSRMVSRDPAQQYVLDYSGHGSTAGFFEGQMSITDSRAVLGHVQNLIGRPIDVLDFSTNCSVGSTGFLGNYSDLARYALVSSEPVGGWGMTEWNAGTYAATQHDQQLANIYSPSLTTEQSLQKALDLRSAYWELGRTAMAAGQIKQSLSAFDLTKYGTFIETARSAPAPYDPAAGMDITGQVNFGSPAVQAAFDQFQVGQVRNTGMVAWSRGTADLAVSDAYDLMLPYRTPIAGGAGADILTGGSGSDTINGMAGDDNIAGHSGDDVLIGLDGADILYGNMGNDVLYGNMGMDTLYGGADADQIFGGKDGDVINGNLGDDMLYGNMGMDTLYGGQGRDTLFGGQDDDWLNGNLGDDVLYGNLGADTFAFSPGGGNDVIADFNAAAGDRIQITAGMGYAVGVAADGSCILDFGGGNSATILSVGPSAFNPGWVFAV